MNCINVVQYPYLYSVSWLLLNLLIFPHQLFADHPGLKLRPSRVVLIEDSLFFGDREYPATFHKQKLWLHRATMKRYESWLNEKGIETLYLEYDEKKESLLRHLKKVKRGLKSTPKKLITTHPTDFMLEKRLNRFCDQLKLPLEFLENPQFINQPADNRTYREGKKRWYMADFYKSQRRRLDLLMDGDDPTGGKWSFDEENRKKVPKKMLEEIPAMPKLKHDDIDGEAQGLCQQTF